MTMLRYSLAAAGMAAAATAHTVCQRERDTISIQRHFASIKGNCTFAEVPSN